MSAVSDQPGPRVWHPIYGEGTILSIHGAFALVAFGKRQLSVGIRVLHEI